MYYFDFKKPRKKQINNFVFHNTGNIQSFIDFQIISLCENVTFL